LKIEKNFNVESYVEMSTTQLVLEKTLHFFTNNTAI